MVALWRGAVGAITWTLPLVAMQRRSEAASAAPKAQQHPQLDWSRMSVMVLAQCGQFSAESKLSGMVRPRFLYTTVPLVALKDSSLTPNRGRIALMGWPAKRSGTPAFHSDVLEWIVSIIAWRSGCTSTLAMAVAARTVMLRPFIISASAHMQDTLKIYGGPQPTLHSLSPPPTHSLTDWHPNSTHGRGAATFYFGIFSVF